MGNDLNGGWGVIHADGKSSSKGPAKNAPD
jgi:hypothetical protein